MLARPQAPPLAESMVTFYQERVVRYPPGLTCAHSEPLEILYLVDVSEPKSH